jgi:hypothetical protein
MPRSFGEVEHHAPPPFIFGEEGSSRPLKAAPKRATSWSGGYFSAILVAPHNLRQDVPERLRADAGRQYVGRLPGLCDWRAKPFELIVGVAEDAADVSLRPFTLATGDGAIVDDDDALPGSLEIEGSRFERWRRPRDRAGSNACRKYCLGSPFYRGRYRGGSEWPILRPHSSPSPGAMPRGPSLAAVRA